TRDRLWIASRIKLHRRSNSHADLSRRSKSLAGILDFEQAVDAHGNDWNAQIICQQTDAGTKRPQIAIRRVMAFRKNQHAVTLVHGVPGIGKAFSEARLARKREKIEQGYAQCPLHPIVDACKPTSGRRRSAQSLESFAAGGSGKTVAKASGQRGED